MDIAPDYGSGDWGFESLRGRGIFFQILLLIYTREIYQENFEKIIPNKNLFIIMK